MIILNRSLSWVVALCRISSSVVGLISGVPTSAAPRLVLQISDLHLRRYPIRTWPSPSPFYWQKARRILESRIVEMTCMLQVSSLNSTIAMAGRILTLPSLWLPVGRLVLGSVWHHVITLRCCSTQDTQTRRYDQILVLTHLQEREEIDKQKLWSENDALERTSACGSLGLENGGGHVVA